MPGEQTLRGEPAVSAIRLLTAPLLISSVADTGRGGSCFLDCFYKPEHFDTNLSILIRPTPEITTSSLTDRGWVRTGLQELPSGHMVGGFEQVSASDYCVWDPKPFLH